MFFSLAQEHIYNSVFFLLTTQIQLQFVVFVGVAEQQPLHVVAFLSLAKENDYSLCMCLCLAQVNNYNLNVFQLSSGNQCKLFKFVS